MIRHQAGGRLVFFPLTFFLLFIRVLQLCTHVRTQQLHNIQSVWNTERVSSALFYSNQLKQVKWIGKMFDGGSLFTHLVTYMIYVMVLWFILRFEKAAGDADGLLSFSCCVINASYQPCPHVNDTSSLISLNQPSLLPTDGPNTLTHTILVQWAPLLFF